MPPSVPPAPAHKFEFNFGVVLQGLILAALLWVGTSVNTLNAQMAAVQVQMADVADLKKRLTASEIDNARQDGQIGNNGARILRLESIR